MTIRYEPEPWHALAACRPADGRLFDDFLDGESEIGPERTRRHKQARAYCRSCPVTETCLSDGLAAKDTGIRGGKLLRDGALVKQAMPKQIVGSTRAEQRERTALIADMHRDGLSQRAIARQLGMTSTAVHQQIVRHLRTDVA